MCLGSGNRIRDLELPKKLPNIILDVCCILWFATMVHSGISFQSSYWSNQSLKKWQQVLLMYQMYSNFMLSSFPPISDHAKFEFPNFQTFHASHSKRSAENVGSTTFRAQVRRSETPEFANRPGFQHLESWVWAAVRVVWNFNSKVLGGRYSGLNGLLISLVLPGEEAKYYFLIGFIEAFIFDCEILISTVWRWFERPEIHGKSCRRKRDQQSVCLLFAGWPGEIVCSQKTMTTWYGHPKNGPWHIKDI